MKIHCQQLLTPQGWVNDQSVWVEQGLITQIESATSAESDYQCDILAPGFIDLQVNGGGGVLLNQHTTASAITHMFGAHQAFGTTAMLPTLITDSAETMARAAQAIVEARQTHSGSIVGVHFEGPWLSQARKGVHPSEHIRAPIDTELQILRNKALGRVMVTLAPETVSPETIRTLVEDDITVFLGHSQATAEQTQAAIDAGATGFTHLFNAMSPLQTREPGMVGVALQSSHCYAGLIVDGFHVDPLCCDIAFKCLGKERLCLVTDAMALAASDEIEMPFFDTTIRKTNNKLTTPDGTLAGSCLTMIDAVRNTVAQGNISVYDALTMASTTPAFAIGVADERGRLEEGMRADMVALDHQLNIQIVFQGGKPCHSAAKE